MIVHAPHAAKASPACEYSHQHLHAVGTQLSVDWEPILSTETADIWRRGVIDDHAKYSEDMLAVLLWSTRKSGRVERYSHWCDGARAAKRQSTDQGGPEKKNTLVSKTGSFHDARGAVWRSARCFEVTRKNKILINPKQKTSTISQQ